MIWRQENKWNLVVIAIQNMLAIFLIKTKAYDNNNDIFDLLFDDFFLPDFTFKIFFLKGTAQSHCRNR